MIRHIVFWKLKEENKIENAEKIKELLEGLKDKIPGLLCVRVGINHPDTPLDNWDIVLTCDLESVDALNAYQVHPLHKAAGEFISKVRTNRACVDFEVK
ncbi:MAG: Dabb family protein [Chitinophagales bacterium]|nr:Dabb family protein [Chitinophagales bacterium]MCZ2392671.1 Dabb family protein [Chitinophagales bacterium]